MPLRADVERCHIGERTAALAGVLDALAAVDHRRRRLGLDDPPPGLDRGLLVDADHEVHWMQELAFPAAGVEVEDAAGLGREVGAGGKDPGADRVLC